MRIVYREHIPTNKAIAKINPTTHIQPYLLASLSRKFFSFDKEKKKYMKMQNKGIPIITTTINLRKSELPSLSSLPLPPKSAYSVSILKRHKTIDAKYFLILLTIEKNNIHAVSSQDESGLFLKKHGTIENYRKEVLEYLSSDNEQ